MIELGEFWIFLGGALLLNITPGQDMAFTLSSAARGTKGSGIAAAGGISVGALAWSIIAAAGLAVALVATSNALTFIRMAGGAYLLFLAVRIITKLDSPIEAQKAPLAGESFRFGVLTNLLNPKVGLFFLAFLPGFVNPDTGSVWRQILFLGAIFSFTSFLILSAFAVGANAVRNTIEDTKSIRIGLNIATAALFLLIGMRMLLTTSL